MQYRRSPSKIILITIAASLISASFASELNFEVNYARFRINEKAAQVEVYVAVPRQQLNFVAENNELLASFECRIFIAKGDSEVIRHNWVAHSIAKDSTEIRPDQVLFTQAAFQLPAENYNFQIHIQDLNDHENWGQRSLEVPVESFEAGRLQISDLEISSRITRDTTRSPFYKNSYTVIPNPGATFGLQQPMLYVYCEIYNLTYPSDSSYSVYYSVFDGQGNEVKSLPPRRRLIKGKELVEVGGLNVVSLQSGSYYLEVRVADHAAQIEASQRKKFFIYRPEIQRPTVASTREAAYELMLNHYRQLTEDELDKEFKTVKYIATKEEEQIYSSLEVEGKQEYLAKFWQARDVQPETPFNEFRDNYLARVRFANENFSGLREGWQTDMGRVLLVYGQPDEVERFTSSTETRPYQVWKYFEIQGGVDFIFVDVNSWGEFQLVHSTARGELSDVDWERWINPHR